MKEIAEYLPEIIKASSTSNLGIVALMLILFSTLSWAFFRQSSEKWKLTAIVLLLLGCILLGYSTLEATKDASDSNSNASLDLKNALAHWESSAETARKANTISSNSPLPTELVNARNEFEKSWRNSSLSDRKKLDTELVSKGLSYANRLYRVTESDSSTKQNANYWADESIRFFEEIQHAYYLTEALIDKAAIFLEISQLGHNDKQQFEDIAKEGDTAMSRAYQTANDEQQATVLRITSRFYYNLARPTSFRLSDEWDNNYLLLAYEKSKKAFEIASKDSKNANQLARVTIKASKNAPQDGDPLWAKKLRDSKEKLKIVLLDSQTTRTGLIDRLSPLNVLGVITLETISREWQQLDSEARRASVQKYKNEIENDALGPLREAVALLKNTQLRKAYGFDIYYDIARTLAVKTDIVRYISDTQSSAVFYELKKNLGQAKENAKTSQLEAAVKDINNEITFGFLTPSEKEELKIVLSIGI